MRPASHHAPESPQSPTSANAANAPKRNDWATVKTLLPYLWAYKWRVAIALAMLFSAKLANIGVPLVLKEIVDALDLKPGDVKAVLVVPFTLLIGYGLLRICVTLFTELRELVFARVTQDAARTIALKVFGHLFGLSLRFHLNRQMGGMSRDIERGSSGINSLISYTLYSILPTLIEITMVITILLYKYDGWFAAIALGALTTYVVFTISVTNWRTQFRREANEQDSRANTKAIDALINYETVKYFGNEELEADRYNGNLLKRMQAGIKSQQSLSILNLGQSLIIAVAVTLLVWRATEGVVAGTMSLGDLVLVNAFMIQLYVPLNFLGVLYREIKQSLTDMERMFRILDENKEIADDANAVDLRAESGARVVFDKVAFAYDPARPILKDISFVIEPGTTTAVVGASGAGKSTLSRLLFRFYDVTSGQVSVNGTDIRKLTQKSLHGAIGVVPQDTVLFNETLRYNIDYGRPGSSDEQIHAVAKAAQLEAFIGSLPKQYETNVGERGLKLSGGEKQRVALARTLLKNPPIVILDEATSALDSHNEQAVQAALENAARGRTTLVIAHRLSTIVDADQILVMHDGAILERGRHDELLALNGAYSRLWMMQQANQSEASVST
jgi:ATP-binding cassette, subfamily B, heavy metal transporter